MTAFSDFFRRGAGRSAPYLAGFTARVGAALRRAAGGRYAEQLGRVERTGVAGLI